MVDEIIDAFQTGKIVLYSIPDGGNLGAGVYQMIGNVGTETLIMTTNGPQGFTSNNGYPRYGGK